MRATMHTPYWHRSFSAALVVACCYWFNMLLVSVGWLPPAFIYIEHLSLFPPCLIWSLPFSCIFVRLVFGAGRFMYIMSRSKSVVSVGNFEIVKNCQSEEQGEKLEYVYNRKKINRIIQRDIEFHYVEENKPSVGLNDPYHMNGYTQEMKVCRHCINLSQDKKLCRCKYAMLNTNFSRMAHYDIRTPNSQLWNAHYNIAPCLLRGMCGELVGVDNFFQQQHLQKLIERTSVCLQCNPMMALTHYYCRLAKSNYVDKYRRQQRRIRLLRARRHPLARQRRLGRNRVLWPINRGQPVLPTRPVRAEVSPFG